MEKNYYQEYADTESHYWWFVARRAIVRRLLRCWLAPDPTRRILDVGCGTGAMLELLQEFGRVEGLDRSPDALRYCRQRLSSSVWLHEGALPEWTPPGRPYDVITAFDVLEHIGDTAATLCRLQQALVSGGTLVCTVPAFQFLWGPHDEVNHHCRRYTLSQLTKDLSDAGFRVSWSSYFNTMLFFPIALSRLLHSVAGRSRNRPQSDLVPVPAFLDFVLRQVFAMERFILPMFSLPVGVSLVVIARNDGTGSAQGELIKMPLDKCPTPTA